MTHRQCSRLFVLVAAISAAAIVGWGVSPVAAQSPSPTNQLPKSPSYVVLDNNGSHVATSASPCSSKGCANGLRITWAKGKCVEGKSGRSNFFRFPPIVGVVTQNGKPVAEYPPVIAPCARGIRIKWDKQNFLTTGHYLQSRRLDANLAYLPSGANDFELFFQGGEGVLSVQWLRNGRSIASISIPSTADEVFWYGYQPPASPFARGFETKSALGPSVRGQVAMPPTVGFFWRRGASHGTSTTTAPSLANDIDFGFYLNNLQRGANRGCVVVGSQAWVSPAMPVEFLTDGRLNSPVVALPCPMSDGTPVHYNDLDVAWQSSGSSNVLTHLTATFDGTALPSSALPQPPAGTNGFLLGFPIDNFKNAFWTQNGSSTSELSVHKSVKSATWYG
jgi:hypothetical protein